MDSYKPLGHTVHESAGEWDKVNGILLSSYIKRPSRITSRSNVKRSIDDNPFIETHFVNGFREVVLNPITSLYVYCYIIKPVNVGNIEAPLLRRVEIPNNILFGETVEIEYSNLQYHPLVSDEIDSIEFDIRDDTNRPIECAFGRTVNTLHFRKKSKNVFSAFNL